MMHIDVFNYCSLGNSLMPLSVEDRFYKNFGVPDFFFKLELDNWRI